ncbi:armadillo-type protein [Gaertneriomyces semiglobifer]|nr:armadillo-type protein [Gaertneriomyces semiglobifer]
MSPAADLFHSRYEPYKLSSLSSSLCNASQPQRASDVIAEARASLKHPSRPYTPAPTNDDEQRSLWGDQFGCSVNWNGIRVTKILTRHQRPLGRPRRLTPLNLHTKDADLADGNANEGPDHDASGDTQISEPMCIPTPEETPSSSACPSRPGTAGSSALRPDVFGRDPQHDQRWTTAEQCLERLTSSTIDDLETYVLGFREAMVNMEWLRSGSDKVHQRRRRGRTLQRILKWMDSTGEPHVAIAGCALVLMLTRNERVLQNACKLLFKLSKNKSYDSSFRIYQCIDSLLTFALTYAEISRSPSKFYGSPCANVIYAFGALKNISDDSQNVVEMVRIGSIRLLAKAANMICDTQVPSLSDDDFMQAVQILTQITATLRNLFSCRKHQLESLEPIDDNTGILVIDVFMKIIQPDTGVTDSGELMLNLARILSKLSLHDRCLEICRRSENTDALIQLVLRFQTEKPLLNRLCFVLGNLTSTLSSTHYRLRDHVPDLVALLDMYLSVELESTESDDENTQEMKSNGSESEEVLIKLIRLHGNLAVDAECGYSMVRMLEFQALPDLLDGRSYHEHDEMVLNVIRAFANFTFYNTPDNVLLKRSTDICRLLVPLLLSDNVEMIAEACRVIGNLSRQANAREVLLAQRVTEILTVLLNHTNADVLYPACGAMINLLSAPTHERLQHKRVVSENNGFEYLVDIFETGIERNDWPLSTIAGKVLYNFCIAESSDILPSEHLRRLQNLLEVSIAITSSADQNEELANLEEVCGRLIEHMSLISEWVKIP